MGKLKSLIIDITEDYARGASIFKLADTYDLPVDEVQEIIAKFYDCDVALI
jgi:alanyl-tRNA synthetase